jgi:hypothetical protein
VQSPVRIRPAEALSELHAGPEVAEATEDPQL